MWLSSVFNKLIKNMTQIVRSYDPKPHNKSGPHEKILAEQDRNRAGSSQKFNEIFSFVYILA